MLFRSRWLACELQSTKPISNEMSKGSAVLPNMPCKWREINARNCLNLKYSDAKNCLLLCFCANNLRDAVVMIQS